MVDLQRLDARVAGPAVHVPKAAHRLVVDPVVSDQDRAVPVDLDPVLVDQGLVDQADLLLLARVRETTAATLFNLKPPLPLNNPDWPLNNPDSESRAKAAHGLKVKMPSVITVDLRLNEPRYASLPNIMKAKKKPLDEKSAADYGVDVTPRLKVVKTTEPAARAAGIKVGSVDELVAKLKEAGAV